jgi:hypothetical protein
MVLTIPSPTRAMTVSSPVDIGADGHTRDRDELDTVFGNRGNLRRLDDLRNNRHLDRFENIAAGQIDGGGALEWQRDVGLIRRDHGVDQSDDIAARKEMRLEIVERNIKPGFDRADARRDYGSRRHPPESHADESEKSDVCSGSPGSDPQRNRHQIQHEDDRHQQRQKDDESSGYTGFGSEHFYTPFNYGRWRRTTMRLPSTRLTTICAPASMNSPSETTSTRSPSTSAIPEGRSGETVVPPLPSQL